VIEIQRKAVRKARCVSTRSPPILFVVDDLADDIRTMGCQLIRELALRVRPSPMVSTMLSTQKMRAIDHACRLQLNALAQFAVRALKDKEVIKVGFTAAADPKINQGMYDVATSDEYGSSSFNLKGNCFPRSFKSEFKPCPSCPFPPPCEGSQRSAVELFLHTKTLFELTNHAVSVVRCEP